MQFSLHLKNIIMPQKRYLFYISQNYSFAILRPLQQAILARGGEIAWFTEGKNVNLNYFTESEMLLTTVYQIEKFSPDAILYPANTAPTFLPGINVAVFHGFDAGKLDKKGNNDHFKIRNCFDLYCTQGPNSTKAFEYLQENNNTFDVIETGWSALDRLFEPEGTFERPNNKQTILMCSTFSKKLTCAPELFGTVKRLSEMGKWRWLIQFHPKMDREIIEQYKSIQSENLTFIETDDVVPLLKQADVMLCDTSSVLIMFLLLNKPVVTFNNISPNDYLIDIDKPELLEESIELALSKPPILMQNIQSFINETHPYQDSKSSERVLGAIDTCITNSDKRKKISFDFFRQLKIRRKLNYWKFW